jgi:hypothetical protein
MIFIIISLLKYQMTPVCVYCNKNKRINNLTIILFIIWFIALCNICPDKCITIDTLGLWFLCYFVARLTCP